MQRPLSSTSTQNVVRPYSLKGDTTSFSIKKWVIFNYFALAKIPPDGTKITKCIRMDFQQQLFRNLFFQESYFVWAFGTTEEGCYGAIDVTTGDSYLFVPRFPPEYAVWMGPPMLLSEFKTKYDVSHVYYVDQVISIFQIF